MKLSGEIIAIMDLQQKSEKFSLREIVVEVCENPKYPQEILFTAMSTESLDAVAGLKVGDFVDVEFNINGRAWEGKSGTRWFNTLRAFKIARVGGAVPKRADATPATPEPAQREPERAAVDDDAMPF
jgi:hypothetical protein